MLAAGLLLAGCSREEPRTVVLDPATGREASAAVAPPPLLPASPQVVESHPPAAPEPAASAPVAAAEAVPQPVVPADGAAAADSEGAALLALRPLIIPVAGIAAQDLRDTYTQARGSRSHEAIDIMAARGTPVHAVDDGRLVKLFNSVPGGLTAYQFDPEGRLAYYYAHLDRYADGLKEGMALKRGDLVGYVGSTGNANPAAPHLHYAVFRLGPERQWWKGTPVNPYLALRNAAPAR